MPRTDPQEGRPPLEGGRQRRRRRVLFASVLVLAALGLAGAASAGLFFYADRQVDRVEVEGIEPVGTPGATIEGADDPDLDLEEVVNVLVVGSDARDALDDEERSDLQIGGAEGGIRTDTIMLVRLDPRQDTVSILSFPRDLRVPLCDGTLSRINAAYYIGERYLDDGPSCLVQTVSDFSGLPIHHYAAVDFPGFIELVDLVGGVTVYLEHEIDDWRANLQLDAGCHRLDGEGALGFVRHRASDSDYGRVARQQRLVKELVTEATRLGNVLNVPRLLRMIDTASDAVQTDQDFSLDLMRRIAFTFRDLDADAVEARTVPGEFEMVDGMAYEVPRTDVAEELFSAFQSGRLHAPPAAETADARDDDEPDADGPEDSQPTPEALEPADVPPLTVLNGAGIGGLATEAQQQLADAGFQIAAVDNADTFDQTTTEVRHPPQWADEAAVVAASIAGADVVEEPQATELVVVLGSDYDPEAAPDEPVEVVRPDGDDAATEDEGAPDEPVEASPPRAIDEEFVGAQPPPDYCYE